MAQHDNRIRTEFFGTTGSERDNASMPYRSGSGIEIANDVVRSRWIAEIGWNHVLVFTNVPGEVGQFCCWPE